MMVKKDELINLFFQDYSKLKPCSINKHFNCSIHHFFQILQK